MKTAPKLPAKYKREVQALMEAFQRWIEARSQTRSVDLRWYDWGDVCLAYPMSRVNLDLLCASADARELCEWADEQTGHRCTLLQALAVAEHLGLKAEGRGEPHPEPLRQLLAKARQRVSN